jgi:hypothetical protein
MGMIDGQCDQTAAFHIAGRLERASGIGNELDRARLSIHQGIPSLNYSVKALDTAGKEAAALERRFDRGLIEQPVKHVARNY